MSRCALPASGWRWWQSAVRVWVAVAVDLVERGGRGPRGRAEMRRVDQGGEGGARSAEGGAVHARGSWPDPCTRTESVPTAGGRRAGGSGWRATSPSSSSPRSTAARLSRLPLAHSRCAGPHSCATMQPQHPPRPASPPQAQTSNGHGEQTLVSPSRSSQAHTADKHPSSAPTRRLTHPLFADKARGIRLRALRFVRPSPSLVPSSPASTTSADSYLLAIPPGRLSAPRK